MILNLGMDCATGTLFDGAGNRLAIIEKRLNLILNEEYVEQDPEQWYRAVVEILEKIQSLDTGIEIGSMAVTYQPGTFVCIGRDGRHLTNAMMPCDRRAKYQIHMCEKKDKRHSGSFSVPWGMMVLPKLQWIKNNKPDIYKRTFKVLSPDGYLSYRLTGETSVDCYSALLMGYDLESGSYNTRLISSLELDVSMFPKVIRAGECAGIISGAKREELKLKGDVEMPVISSRLMPLMEIAASLKKGTMVFDVETSSLCLWDDTGKAKGVKRALKLPYRDKHIYYMPGDYEYYFVKWMDRYTKDLKRVDDYTPGSHGLMVLPHVMGSNKLYGSDIKGSVLGIGDNNAFDMLTASYEAMGYLINEKLEYLSDYGLNPESIEILSPFDDPIFYRIVSNITSTNVTAVCEEAILACLYRIVGGGDMEYESGGEIFSPEDDLSVRYKLLYDLYKSTSDSLNGVYRKRRRVLKRISM